MTPTEQVSDQISATSGTRILDLLARLGYEISREFYDHNILKTPEWDRFHEHANAMRSRVYRYWQYVVSGNGIGWQDNNARRFLHNEWVARLVADGWTRGPRDYKKKQHPHVMPFDEMTEADLRGHTILYTFLDVLFQDVLRTGNFVSTILEDVDTLDLSVNGIPYSTLCAAYSINEWMTSEGLAPAVTNKTFKQLAFGLNDFFDFLEITIPGAGGVYIASSANNKTLVGAFEAALKALGINVVSGWSSDTDLNYEWCSIKDYAAVEAADVVIGIAPFGPGTTSELGYALGLGKTTIWIGSVDTDPLVSFHPGIVRMTSRQAIDFLIARGKLNG